MTLSLYGITNCDTMRRARRWLDDRGVAYRMHDYRKAGVDEADLRRWIAELGWPAVLNRNGTTFRKLPDADTLDLDAEKAIAIMLGHSSAIRRPVLEGAGTLVIGFDPDRYDHAVAALPAI